MKACSQYDVFLSRPGVKKDRRVEDTVFIKLLIDETKYELEDKHKFED